MKTETPGMLSNDNYLELSDSIRSSKNINTGVATTLDSLRSNTTVYKNQERNKSITTRGIKRINIGKLVQYEKYIRDSQALQSEDSLVAMT